MPTGKKTQKLSRKRKNAINNKSYRSLINYQYKIVFQTVESSWDSCAVFIYKMAHSNISLKLIRNYGSIELISIG